MSTKIKAYPAIQATLDKCGMPIVPPGHRCVAIVDPPRGGLHPKVTKALRMCDAIDTLVYVSCNPFGSFVEDAVRLCTPENTSEKSYGKHSKGKPFVPLRAAPVDMFPDTRHCELVMAFSRDVAALDIPIPGERRKEKDIKAALAKAAAAASTEVVEVNAVKKEDSDL